MNNFREKKMKTRVIGCPKTIDGDLKCKEVPTSFGYDTACKVILSFAYGYLYSGSVFFRLIIIFTLDSDIFRNDWECYGRCSFIWEILSL